MCHETRLGVVNEAGSQEYGYPTARWLHSNMYVKNTIEERLILWLSRDICVHIEGGEFCALMGPSGSGKSTFLHLVGGLDVATSGEILIGGHSTRSFGDKEWTTMRRQRLGIVFQAFHLVPGLTAAGECSPSTSIEGRVKSVHRPNGRRYAGNGGHDTSRPSPIE